jgi:hypothetical protein
VEARLRQAAQVLQEPESEKAYEPGESRAVFPSEVECAWQSQAAFRAPHLVERAGESWPPES